MNRNGIRICFLPLRILIRPKKIQSQIAASRGITQRWKLTNNAEPPKNILCPWVHCTSQDIIPVHYLRVNDGIALEGYSLDRENFIWNHNNQQLYYRQVFRIRIRPFACEKKNHNIFLFIMKGEHIKGQCHWGFELGSFLPFERFCKILGLGRSRIRVGKISDPDPNYFNSDPQKWPLRKTIYRTYWSLFCLTSFLLRLPVLIYELKSVHMLNTWGASGFLVP